MPAEVFHVGQEHRALENVRHRAAAGFHDRLDVLERLLGLRLDRAVRRVARQCRAGPTCRRCRQREFPGVSVADAFIPCGMTVVRCAAASDGRINAAATTRSARASCEMPRERVVIPRSEDWAEVVDLATAQIPRFARDDCDSFDLQIEHRRIRRRVLELEPLHGVGDRARDEVVANGLVVGRDDVPRRPFGARALSANRDTPW